MRVYRDQCDIAAHCLSLCFVSCVPYVASCSELSNFDCHFGLVWFGLWRLTPLSTIFQLYQGGKFIGGGIRSTMRKSLRYSLTFI